MAAMALLGGLAAARPAEAQDDPWDSGANWLTLRGGYAKSAVDRSGQGGLGYGIGFSHMLHKWKVWRWTLFKQFSVGGHVHHENISRVASAGEIEVAATLELVRHFDWNSPFHPYLGVGTGPVYRKTHRTGDDQRNVELGHYFSVGGNVPISRMQVVGLDIRLLRVDATNVPENPVFGIGSGEYDVVDGETVIKSKKGTHWSVKLGYSLVY
jgi:outer membrane protein W